MMNKYLLAALVVLLQSGSHVLLKMGVDQKHWTFILPINLYTLTGYVCVVLSFVSWIYYLKLEKLNVATAMVSAVYILIPILSYFFLGEVVSQKAILGFSFILIGVVLTCL